MTQVKVIYGECIRVGELLTHHHQYHLVGQSTPSTGTHPVRFEDGEVFKTLCHWPEWWPNQAIYDYLQCENMAQKLTLSNYLRYLKKWGGLDDYSVTLANGTVYGKSIISYVAKTL